VAARFASPACSVLILRCCGNWLEDSARFLSRAVSAVRQRVVSTGGQAASGTRRTAEGGCATLLSTDCYGHESRTVKKRRRLLSSFG
jgi:hypothetical protein